MSRAHLPIKLLLLLSFMATNIYALPKYGVAALRSPNHEYTLKLVDTAHPAAYNLTIWQNKNELARYAFEGELVSACWSPSLRFVAVNNNDAHGGIYVWIISLIDGSIITSHGAIKALDYDRYSDYIYFVDLPHAARVKLKEVYPGVDNDPLREGYSTVAYGWRRGDRLLLFHELPFDNLYAKEDLIIQAYTASHVASQALSLEAVSFRKVRNQPYEPMPSEVKKTLNFMN